MSTVYEPPAAAHTSSLDGCGEATSTKVLHEPADGKPAITLTTYKHGSSTVNSLLHLFKPIDTDPSPYVSSAPARAFNSARHWPALAEHEQPELKQLKKELEVHFQGMKSEFEEKTGRNWAPLKAWPKEQWEWDGEEMVDLRLGDEE